MDQCLRMLSEGAHAVRAQQSSALLGQNRYRWRWHRRSFGQSQRRFGGCCLLSARPMMAAFSSWLSSRLAGLRLGTIENMPGRRAGPAVDPASDGGAGGGVARSGLGAGAACCACSAARARSRVWIVWARSAARSSAARRRVRSSSKACSSSRTRSSTDWPAVRPLEGPFCCAWSGLWAWRGRRPAASRSWVGMRQGPR